MRFLISDLYIKCDDLIKDANILYNIAINKELSAPSGLRPSAVHKDDILYITSMNKYINSYENYKESKIKQYIQDLNEYIFTC
jgi:hypothetical protein